jgi:pimeloyl-ACP methyl ester carboxylesterase
MARLWASPAGTARLERPDPLPSTPVLLLHGQPGSARDWASVQARLDGTTAIAIDRPGWDGSSRPSDLSGNALAACQALERAGAQRAVIVGHSLGAAVAVRLAILHPERVAALVLVAPSANMDSLYPLDHLLAQPGLGYVAGAGALVTSGLLLAAAPVRRRLAGTLRLDERYLRSAGRSLLTPATWRAFASDQRALVTELPGLEARLGDIRAPTTIVAGSADRMVPIAAARRLATQIPGAELVVLERASHLLPQQHAGRVAVIIAAVAARAEAPAGRSG